MSFVYILWWLLKTSQPLYNCALICLSRLRFNSDTQTLFGYFLPRAIKQMLYARRGTMDRLNPKKLTLQWLVFSSRFFLCLSFARNFTTETQSWGSIFLQSKHKVFKSTACFSLAQHFRARYLLILNPYSPKFLFILKIFCFCSIRHKFTATFFRDTSCPLGKTICFGI